MSRKFISYAREDRAAAKRLYKDLKAIGADPWLDEEDLLPGQTWDLEINQAIKHCSHFIALISGNSVNKRGYVQKELRKALDILDEYSPGEIFVIPARLDDSEPSHEKLSKLHWVDLFPSWEMGVEKIAKSLGLKKKSEPINQFDSPQVQNSSIQDVIHKIRAKAAKDFPNNFSTQKYQIDKETQAWREIQNFSDSSIPDEILQPIINKAKADFSDNYLTCLYQIKKEIESWKEIYRQG